MRAFPTAAKGTWHKAAALARKWQLNQLAGRLEEMARKTSPTLGRGRRKRDTYLGASITGRLDDRLPLLPGAVASVVIEQRGDHDFVDPLGLERHTELVV